MVSLTGQCKYGFSHSLTLEAVASHHPTIGIGSRGFIRFDVSGTMLKFRCFFLYPGANLVGQNL
jgi:hypothetical protein